MTCSPTKKNNAFYQIGRLFSYLLLAAISGAIGHLLNINNSSSNISLFFGILIGMMFIWFGLANYFKSVKAPRWLSRFILDKWKRILPKSPSNVTTKSSFAVGAFSIFLPCGFLYGVLLALASFQSPLISMISIFTFWLGTLPVMGFASAIINKVLKPVAQKMPLVTSSFLIIVGLVTIYYRIDLMLTPVHSCH